MSITPGNREPNVQLPPAPYQVVRQGPLHQVELVIELAGHVPLVGPQARMPLAPDWFQALGQPMVWAMALGSDQWERIALDSNGSYDSLALTWPLVTPAGRLSTRSAFDHGAYSGPTSEPPSIAGRSRCPSRPKSTLPSPTRTVVESIDIGFSLGVAFGINQPEEAPWCTASALGLAYNAELGAFVWIAIRN